MRSNRNTWLVAALFLGMSAVSTHGQVWCDSAKLKAVTDFEKDYRVIDARPSEVNKVRGKMAFKKKAQVAIVNMNPFMFKYEVKVDQTQTQDTAVLDFLKLLGAPITDLAGIASFRAVADSQAAEELTGGDLKRLIDRTGGIPAPAPGHNAPPPPGGTCAAATVPIATQALDYLAETRDELLRLKDEIEVDLSSLKLAYAAARNGYLANQDILYSPSSDGPAICSATNNLMANFLTHNLLSPQQDTGIKTYPTRERINKLKDKIARLDSLINELKSSATTFKGDPVFTTCQARLKGFDYADSLIRLAEVMGVYRAALEKRASTMSDETKAYDFLVKTIRTFATINAGIVIPGTGTGMVLLQRTFDIIGQYDISTLDIQLIPTELQPLKPFNNPDEIDAFRAKVRVDTTSVASGYAQFATQQINDVPVTTVGDTGTESLRTASARASRSQGVRSASSFASEQPAGNGDKPAEDNRTRANATIGARRFELSAGMAFSTLDRREFKSVLGYARNVDGVIVDADGKPTDKRDLTNIVGLGESSKHRFAPLVMLHTRITNNPKYNLFFSVGVTAKKDTVGTDVEYLLGPSFNFLNKNAFFTFGGYAGRQQKLAGDLFVGAKLPGTDVPISKEYKWAPAFSFTYRIPIKGEPGQ
jgi:hypothetical protein